MSEGETMTTTKNALAVVGASAIDVVPEDKRELLRHTYAQDLNEAEFELFVHAARRQGLDPFAGQVTASKRGGRMTIQTTIDGFRSKAEETGEYEGQTPAMWCDKDGNWTDVWLSSKPPAAARVGVYRKGFREPMVAVAQWEVYNQGQLFWKKGGGAHMLAKCAESLALRKAFPRVLGGLYTNEEMAQAAGGARAEPEASDSAPVVEAEWQEPETVPTPEERLSARGWTTEDAAKALNDRYRKQVEWKRWASVPTALEWLLRNIEAGAIERPATAQMTPDALVKIASDLRVSPKESAEIINHAFEGKTINDLSPAELDQARLELESYAANRGDS